MGTQYEYWFGHATGAIQMNLFYCVSVLYLNGEARDQSLQDVAGPCIQRRSCQIWLGSMAKSYVIICAPREDRPENA